jgi:hypothetical protein|nr:MAG TPA: hypothetical protein [Herelleviridae sp.]
MNLTSLVKTSRTPMTDDEKGAIKRSARMGTYVVARVIGFVVWVFISLWITMWGALKVVPNMGSLIQNALGVTSANAPSSESFITYWVAPMLLTTLVISAGVIALCTWMWRVMNRGFDSMKRWVDRAGVVADGEVTPSLDRAKKVDSLDEDEPKKKKKSRRR